VEEKPLSESSKTFTLTNFDALGEEKRRLSELPTESSNIRDSFEAERTEERKSPQKESSYQLNELIIESPSMRRGFTYDSENARNFDQATVNKAKEGVKEILKDSLGKAKRQAMDIKAHAQKQGHDEGYAEGFKKGEDAAREELKPFLETLEELVSDLTGFRKDMYDKVEREMVEMVIRLAKKVIHFEFSTRDNAVQEMIRLAVQSVLDRESMVIKINPTDKGYAESFRPELNDLFGDIKNITFEGHSGVGRGGCVVETNFGVVDARIDNLEEQMDRILNLAPMVSDELAAAASVQMDPVVKEGSEVSSDEINQSEENEAFTDDQIQSEENDAETESPEETS
jgi:flagellar assembly protein FliH